VAVSVAQSDQTAADSARRDAGEFKAQGMTILAPPHEVSLGKRAFIRTDMQSAQADPPMWITMLETTVSRHFRVTLEIRARSRAELDQLDAVAQSLVIAKP